MSHTSSCHSCVNTGYKDMVCIVVKKAWNLLQIRIT